MSSKTSEISAKAKAKAKTKTNVPAANLEQANLRNQLGGLPEVLAAPDYQTMRDIVLGALGTIGDVRPTFSALEKIVEGARRENLANNFLRNLTIDQWLDAKIGPLICNVNNRQQLRNLLKRVIVLVQRIVMDNSITSVILLDGHGRTLYLLLQGLKICEDLIEPERLAQLKQNITVVEATDAVQEFHENCFPNEVTCVQSDVFTHLRGINFDSTLVYLNFCGLGIPGVKNSLRTTVNRLTELIDTNPPHLMVSYAMRGLHRSPSKRGLTDKLNQDYGSRNELERRSHGGMKTWYSWDRYDEEAIEQAIGQERMERLQNITIADRAYNRDFILYHLRRMAQRRHERQNTER